MTKEELKQKAYEYAIKEIPFIECITQNDLEILVQQAYITGAESREKHIEELIALINAERERQEKCDDVHLRTIADIEKENAELKKQLEHRNCVDCSNHGSNIKLTKAKEYIKLLLMNCVGVYESTGKTIAEIQAEAEQFLKDSEVEK